MGVSEGLSTVLGTGQPGDEPAHLGQVGVAGPFGQRLALQPAPVAGQHCSSVQVFALCRWHPLAPCSHGLSLLVEPHSRGYHPTGGHVSGSPGLKCFH